MTYIQHISTRSLDSTELLTTPGFQGGSQVIDTLCQVIPGQHLGKPTVEPTVEPIVLNQLCWPGTN